MHDEFITFRYTWVAVGRQGAGRTGKAVSPTSTEIAGDHMHNNA